MVSRSLAMRHIDQQSHVHGAINSSTTFVDRGGILDATITLFESGLGHLKSLPVRDVTETDNLTASKLTHQVQQQLISHPDLAEPDATVPVLQAKSQLIRELRGKRPTKLLRDVDAIVASVIAPALGRIRSETDLAIGGAPHQGPRIVEQVRAVLNSLVIPDPNSESLTRLGRLVRALSELGHRQFSLPRKTIEFAVQRLTERALPEYDAAIHALAEEWVSAQLKLELPRLNEYCEESLARVALFHQNIAKIHAAVLKLRRESVISGHISKSSVVLELPGPKDSDVIAGLRSRLRCSDQGELSGVLFDRWIESLRPLAERWVPTSAPVGVILSHVDPDEAALAFVQLIESLLGEGHSLYEIIDRYGVTRVATELFNRAEQLGSLQSRDIEAFNVTPLTLTIVRLPPPVGPRDSHIRDQLHAAFVNVSDGKCIQLSCSSAERNAVTVVRSKTGFPIGIEGGNETLLLEYVKAAAAGHLPHLVGVISATDHGEALVSYLKLGQRLGPDYPEEQF